MNIFINTRNVTKDYRYIGKAPNDSWTSPYKKFTSFEHNSVIVEKNKKNYRIFLTGVSGNRVDRVKTPIRYSILIEGLIDKENENDKVASLVNNWVRAAFSDAESSSLGNRLDKILDEETIDSAMNGSSDKLNKVIKDSAVSFINSFSSFTSSSTDIGVKPGKTVIKSDHIKKFSEFVHQLITGGSEHLNKLAKVVATCSNYIENDNDFDKFNVPDELDNAVFIYKDGITAYFSKQDSKVVMSLPELPRDYRPNDELAQLVKKKDLENIRQFLMSGLRNMRVDITELAPEAIYVYNNLPEVFEEPRDSAFLEPIDNEQSHWIPDYFYLQQNFLNRNFTLERYLHLINVRTHLMESGDPVFQKIEVSKPQYKKNSKDSLASIDPVHREIVVNSLEIARSLY